MGKRKNGEGSWATVTKKGYTYKRFRSPEGKEFFGKTEKEVKAKYKDWKNKGSIDMSYKKVTVLQVSEKWLESKKKHVKASTFDGYEYFVEGILGKNRGYDMGNRQIQQLTVQNVQEYVDSWSDFLPKSSMKKNKALLSQVFKYARKQGIIAIDLMEDIKLPIDDNIVKKTKKAVFISTEDRAKLEAEESRMYSNNKRIYGNNAKMIIFLLHTGLRFGELTALCWKNVDMENKKIFIVENKPIIKNRNNTDGKKYILDSTSTKRKASERYIPLSDKAYEIIQYFYMNYPHGKEDHVFCNDKGNYAQRRNVGRTVRAMLKAADCEVKDASPHDLRHSFGSELIKNGVDIKVVSELMGHKDIQTTYNIYIHILTEQKVNAIEMFNKNK